MQIPNSNPDSTCVLVFLWHHIVTATEHHYARGRGPCPDPSASFLAKNTQQCPHFLWRFEESAHPSTSHYYIWPWREHSEQLYYCLIVKSNKLRADSLSLLRTLRINAGTLLAAIQATTARLNYGARASLNWNYSVLCNSWTYDWAGLL